MKIKFFGGAKEVGRSSILLNHGNLSIMLDCGVKLENGVEYPAMPSLDKIDFVMISHAHLDHTGALPYFNEEGLICPIFATQATKDLTKLLLEDALKIAKKNHDYLYDEANVKKVINLIQTRNLNAKYELGQIKYEFFDAGHIPGSAAIVVGIDGKKILYTGDINTKDTRLLKGANTNYGEIDVMICESTYGDKNHEERMITEKRFVNKIKERLEHGSVLIPVFGVGRAQELLMLLDEHDFNCEIFLDGMAMQATLEILKSPHTLKDSEKLRAALHHAQLIDSYEERKEAERERAIILTTSGMLTGGPVMEYLKKMHSNKNDSILLTGYQAVGTNGRMLLEKGEIDLDERIVRVKSYVEQFDFSAHAGMQELHDLIKKIMPKKLVLVHGDPPALKSLMLFASELGIEVIIPQAEQEIEI